MRAISLFAVLTAAHILTLAGSYIPFSFWTPIAYLWQDTLVALIFAALDGLIPSKRLVWILYALLVLYIAVNVPIGLVLSSPLTLTMMRAARGPLADSIAHHLTIENIGTLILTAGAGLLLPLLLSRLTLRPKTGIVLVVASLAAIGAGPTAVSKVDTGGRHRNALSALWPISLPHPVGLAENDNWRMSPFCSILTDDLSHYRASAAGRNVVIVILESTGARYLQPYGSSIDPMRNLTRLASRGIVFENAYAVYPESVKGYSSVLCSRYPAFNVRADAYSQVACSSLARRIKNRGYRTALFHSGRFMYLGMQSVIQDRGFDVLEDAGDIGGNVNSSFGVDEPATVKRILSWVDSLPRGERFFVTYLPIAGHHPYSTPEAGPFVGNTELDRYLNALHYADWSLAELFTGLQKRNLDKNTLFFIFGDHGEAFGQHEGNFGHSLFIYEENLRVPYFIVAPDLIRDQIRVSRTASLIDTAPTILDLLGLPASVEFQGFSLLDPQSRMALFFTDYSLGWLGLRDSCWKYLYLIDSRRSKLYDVCRDPDETKDLSATQGDRVQVYRSRLEQWIAVQ